MSETAVKAVPNSRCHFCGAEYEEQYREANDQLCKVCQRWNYREATPIAVLLIPAPGGGLFAFRQKGKGTDMSLSLPLARVKRGNDWRRCVAEWVGEHLGLIVAAPSIDVMGAQSSTCGNSIIVSGVVNHDVDVLVGPFTPAGKVAERVNISRGLEVQLTDPLQREMATAFFTTQIG